MSKHPILKLTIKGDRISTYEKLFPATEDGVAAAQHLYETYAADHTSESGAYSYEVRRTDRDRNQYCWTTTINKGSASNQVHVTLETVTCRYMIINRLDEPILLVTNVCYHEETGLAYFDVINGAWHGWIDKTGTIRHKYTDEEERVPEDGFRLVETYDKRDYNTVFAEFRVEGDIVDITTLPDQPVTSHEQMLWRDDKDRYNDDIPF